jgi:hypothetical protein
MRGFRVQGPGPRILVAMLLVTGLARAQEITFDGTRPAAKQHIVLLSDAVQVEAGKPQLDPGFHINSHTPHDEMLIPTVLKLDPADNLQIQDAQYPAGTAFRLPIGAGETLDVYQGEFRVLVRVLARKGQWSLVGGLRYQACDNAACFPPKTLPVKIAVEAR